jgi:hypothetical protein
VNCAINAAFAKVWSVEFNEPGWCLPYVVDGSAAGGEALLGILDGFLATLQTTAGSSRPGPTTLAWDIG